MTHQRMLQHRVRNVTVSLFAFLVLIAASINVPWALTFMHSRTAIPRLPMAAVHGPEAARPWPSNTPHDEPWPTPNYWSEGGVFGCRVYNVRAREGFNMALQRLGWPLPVIEQKQMSWDWSDGSLAGPEPDPSPSLLLRGLILNPLILGGGAWAILVLPWTLAIVGMRRFRRRRNRCLHCGYPVGTSAVCTECGSPLRPDSNGSE